MTPQAVQQMIEQGMPGSRVEVEGDGSKFEAQVVSDAFAGLSTLKRHQQVYAVVGEHITSGAIHALTIKAYTPDEVAAR
ncbi:MAG: BolA family transcriptional regulator [Acidihalobacter sp.]|jgi:acid stress-induced BolA-like protein IbaG/YrbA